jgi:hypothetical protein
MMALWVSSALFMMRLMYYDMRFTRLELSPKGIKYYQPGLVLCVQWQDVLALEKQTKGMVTIWVLKLNTPKVELQGVGARILRRSTLVSNLPLTPFVLKWPQGNLCNELKVYKPELF